MTTRHTIRPERPGDADAISRLLRAAFEGDAEDGLVSALRGSDAWLPDLSFVLCDGGDGGDGGGGDGGDGGGGDGGDGGGGDVLAYVLFSRIRVGGVPALACGPVAVRPDRQGAGLGTAVMAEGLERATASGETIVVLLGEPAFYGRFGFVPGARFGLTGAWSHFDDAWQVLVLPGAADPKPAEVVHPGPWRDL